MAQASIRMTPTEKVIENQILAFLRSRQVLAFKIKSVGTFDPKLRIFRTPSPFYRKGVSDILGIVPKTEGRLLAIEVKSAKGRLRPEQQEFIDEVNEAGGLAFVARSVEDVQAMLGIA